MTVDEFIQILEPHRGKQIRIYDRQKYAQLRHPVLRNLLYLEEAGDSDGEDILKPNEPWILLDYPRGTA